ncbi:hypothetical protein [Actomonas aquatica]|uniref:HD/PDEase domain-containing protein n=1 Tax=Actomonas aquatica TaxID=2866162 RepID=A0ABZ1C975_9BACT|nr:hypothetical protein [Opitutus sp. WL0086]WRQ88038.1 hypothetical protein K1X11_001375 [Opitutus sp. WL0086]
MFPDVDTRDANAVHTAIRGLLIDTFPESDAALFDATFAMVRDMFEGRFPGLREIDVRYHDFQHTLQASLCMAELLHGYVSHGAKPDLSERDFQLGLAAVLLHDAGYLQTAADGEGSGARFTYAHVLRSCAAAASHLPRFGVRYQELTIVMGAIRCTGPDAKIAQLYFNRPQDRILGAGVATADYLSQMAASDYPEELEILYGEFEQSDDYLGVPTESRLFKSAADLIAKTPGFWSHVVRPKLDNEFGAIYQHLARPFPDGPNAYLDAIERNIAIIAELPQSSQPA